MPFRSLAFLLVRGAIVLGSARPASQGVPEFDCGAVHPEHHAFSLPTVSSRRYSSLPGCSRSFVVAPHRRVTVLALEQPPLHRRRRLHRPALPPGCRSCRLAGRRGRRPWGRQGGILRKLPLPRRLPQRRRSFMRLPLPSGGGQLRQEPVPSLPCGLAPMAPCLRPWRVRAGYRVITACRASSRASPSSCRFFARSGSVIPAPISGDSALIPRVALGFFGTFPSFGSSPSFCASA